MKLTEKEKYDLLDSLTTMACIKDTIFSYYTKLRRFEESMLFSQYDSIYTQYKSKEVFICFLQNQIDIIKDIQIKIKNLK